MVVQETLPAVDVAAQYLERGLARKVLGRNDEALIDLTFAINPNVLSVTDQARALNARGQILDALGNKKEAAADYEGARRLVTDVAKISQSPSVTAAQPAPDDRIVLTPPSSSEPTDIIHLIPPKPASQRIILKPPPGAPALGLKPALVEDGQTGLSQIQLGSWRTQAEADEAWIDFKARAGDVLQSFSPTITQVDLPGKGRYYRLRLGPMDKAHARAMCAALKSRNMACLIA